MHGITRRKSYRGNSEIYYCKIYKSSWEGGDEVVNEGETKVYVW